MIRRHACVGTAIVCAAFALWGCPESKTDGGPPSGDGAQPDGSVHADARPPVLDGMPHGDVVEPPDGGNDFDAEGPEGGVDRDAEPADNTGPQNLTASISFQVSATALSSYKARWMPGATFIVPCDGDEGGSLAVVTPPRASVVAATARVINTADFEPIGGAVLLDDGSIIAGGRSTMSFRSRLARFDGNGAVLWQMQLGTLSEISQVAFVDPHTVAVAYKGLGFALVDLNGTVSSEVSFDAPTAGASALLPLSGGGFILAARMIGNPGPFDAYLIRADATGAIVWQKTYPNMDIANLTETTDGFVAVSFAGGDYSLMRFAGDGMLRWQKVYGGASLSGVLADANGLTAFGTVMGEASVLDLDMNGAITAIHSYADEGTAGVYVVGGAITPEGGVGLIGSGPTGGFSAFYTAPDRTLHDCADTMLASTVPANQITVTDGAAMGTDSAIAAMTAHTATRAATINAQQTSAALEDLCTN